jgi:hypothetical protein
MFTEDTVIILGAGASCHYGYPTGEQLINNIIDDIKSQDFLKNKKEFQDLAKDLELFSPLSIDYFLHHFEKEHGDVGRKMIAYEILKCERIITRSIGHQNKKRNSPFTTADDDGNWYKFLVDAIISQHKTAESLLNAEEKLIIITFNYDVSLEYYLYDKIAKNPFFTREEKKYGEEFLKTKLHIYHVYGALYQFDWQIEGGVPKEKYGTHISPVSPVYDPRSDDERFFEVASKFSENIKVIAPNKMDQIHQKMPYYRNKIKKAKNIFILGYGFDLNNSDLLFYEQTREIDRRNIFNMEVEGKNTDNPEDHYKNIFFTNKENSLKINNRIAKIVFNKIIPILQKEPIIEEIAGKIAIPEKKSYPNKTILTKSEKTVYDALAYDFDFI